MMIMICPKSTNEFMKIHRISHPELKVKFQFSLEFQFSLDNVLF